MTVFRKTRQLSVWAIGGVIAISVVLSLVVGSGSANWQVWLAVGALAVGIPHGALDHVVTVPGMGPGKMTVFVVGYVTVAAIALAAIIVWPVWGFIFVVVMSAVHFGMGDASFVRQETPPARGSGVPWWVYAIPAGSLPVVIPLTREGSADALALVNPDIVGWHFGADLALLWGTLVCAAAAVFWLLASRRVTDARDLILLALLALLTPPLVAFAAYFGLWHALRHTARLSQEMADTRELSSTPRWLFTLWRVSVPGLPALIGTMAVAGAITFIGGWALTDYLWIALAVVWALTVPHMALTWRLDRAALAHTGEPVTV